jgi:hypothetical protein
MRVTFGSMFRNDIINRLSTVHTRAAYGRNAFLTQVQREALAGEIRGAASAIRTAAQGSTPADVSDALEALATAVQAGDTSGIDQGLSDLGQALDRGAAAQTLIGMDLPRLSEDRARLDTRHHGSIGALVSAGRLSPMDSLK